jgi:two-component sensor histidine kinase
MVERAMARQLDGDIEKDWAPQGLVVRLRMNKDKVAQ